MKACEILFGSARGRDVQQLIEESTGEACPCATGRRCPLAPAEPAASVTRVMMGGAVALASQALVAPILAALSSLGG